MGRVPEDYKNTEGYADIVVMLNFGDYNGVKDHMVNYRKTFREIEWQLKQFIGCDLNTIEKKDFLLKVADLMISKPLPKWSAHTLRNRVIEVCERHDLDCSVDDLYDLVVEEYNDVGDDHKDATTTDILEIYQASY